MATISAMMAAGASRLVANLYRNGKRRRDVRRALLRRFGDSADASIEGVIDRSRAWMQAADLLNAREADQRLRAGEMRAADRGCTLWRYFYALDWADEGSGTHGTVSGQVTDDMSLTREQVENAATAAFEGARRNSFRLYGSKEVPKTAIAGSVHIITVERACP